MAMRMNSIRSLSALLFHSVCFFLLFMCQTNAYAEVASLLEDAETAQKAKNFPVAESLFQKILEQEPDNMKALQSMIEIKIAMKKFSDADQILARILALPVTRGRNVLITLEGSAEPLEAEIVDENVLAPIQGKNNTQNYIENPEEEPVPQYRLYIKKTGEVRLIPKTEAKIKYMGIPLSVHEKMQVLQNEVKRQIVATDVAPQESDEMVAVKGGCFLMGAMQNHPDEMPTHEVCVSSFKIGKYEVTQSAFQAKMGNNPSRFVGSKLPVDSATWDEALAYCKKTGKRLPTEAEWEYAARGGTKTEYYTGNKFTGKDGNFCDSACTANMRDTNETDGFQFTAPVGSFPPNPFGLHDMAGNLSEWVSDWLLEHYYQFSPKDNPKGPELGDSKVFRGGAWNGTTEMLRSAKRMAFWPGYRYEEIGFRCAADQ